jgi:hypothetical protein
VSGRTTRKYGFPFKGYMGSLPHHVCPPDYAAVGSRNLMFQPADGSFIRRGGRTLEGDTSAEGLLGYANEVTGLLEGKWSSRPRKIGELSSPTLAAPTYSCLYTKETIATGYLDDGRFGQLYFRGTSTNEVCGKGSGATQYTGAGDCAFKCVPLWYDSGEGGLTRLTTKFSRRFHCPGSRNYLDVGDWRHFPSYRGTPSRWNRRFNAGSGTSESEIHLLSGPVPPLWCPTFAYSAEVAASTSKNWRTGANFYGSVMFQNEDGSWSMPAVPRPISTTLTSGLGFAQLPHVDDAKYIDTVTWTIPIGPPGTTRRALLRSDQGNVTEATTVSPAYDKLKIVAVIEDNTSVTYVDTKGDDTALLDDPDHLYFRWDHIMPPPSRHIWDFDGRTAHGYGRTSRCAIFLAPTAVTAAKDLNLAMDSSAYGASQFFVRVDGTHLQLKYQATATTTAVSEDIDIGTKTLQELVDAINATTTSSGCKEWRAQVAPGASVMAPAANLLCHSTTVDTCSGSAGDKFIVTSASFANLAVGARVKPDTGGKITATNGIYVKKVETATKLWLCDGNGDDLTIETGGVAPQTLTFYTDLGDTEPHDDVTYGNQRVVSGSYYACLYFKNSHFAKEPSGKSAVWMTVGGPMQVRQSANAFVSAASNKHIPPGSPGICMGGGGLADGCVVLFANERHVLRNTRGGRTGLDEDYRLDRMSRTGCIASAGVTIGYGWVGFPSWEGYMACDVGNEINLTRTLWDAGAKRGEFYEEFRQCLNNSARDVDSSTFYAAVIGNRIHLTYRYYQIGTVPTRRVVMDFGEGSQASGLGQLLDPDGQPWGWSTPLYSGPAGSDAPGPSCVGSVRSAGGFLIYGAVASNAGTNDGRIDKFDLTARYDIMLSYPYSSACLCAKDFFDSLRHKAANDTIVKFDGTEGEVGLSASMTGTSSSAAVSTVPLLATDVGKGYTRQVVQWGQSVRGKNEALYLTLSDDGTSAKQSVFWGAETSADLLDTYD